MNEVEDRITRAFEALSASSPDGAPPTVANSLQETFRRHHLRRRRQRQVIGIVGVLTCMAAVAFISWRSSSPRVEPRQTFIAKETPDKLPPPPSPSPNDLRPAPRPQNRDVIAKSNRPPHARISSASSRSQFVPLPSYNAAFSNGDVRIVRLGLTNTDLHQMGAPQLGYPGASRTLADVMLDADGIPIAVRRVER